MLKWLGGDLWVVVTRETAHREIAEKLKVGPASHISNLKLTRSQWTVGYLLLRKNGVLNKNQRPRVRGVLHPLAGNEDRGVRAAKTSGPFWFCSCILFFSDEGSER